MSLQENTSVIFTWLFGIPLLFFVILRSTNLFMKENTDFISYDFTCLLIIIYLVVAGIIAWFELFGVDITEAKTNPFFGRSSYVIDHLISPLAAYQFWNLIFCLLYKEMRTLQILAHHAFAFILSLCGLDSFLHYWAIFFFGITEISSIPLTVMSIMNHLYGTKKKKYSVYRFCRVAFAVTFLYVRVLIWPFYYLHCIYQAFQYYIDGTLYPIYFYIFASSSTSLTILQLIWGSKIIKNIISKD